MAAEILKKIYKGGENYREIKANSEQSQSKTTNKKINVKKCKGFVTRKVHEIFLTVLLHNFGYSPVTCYIS